MPLVVLCGQPCSGKSRVAAKLADAFRALGHDVSIVDEPSLHLIRNESYKAAVSEKHTRGKLKSAVERALSQKNQVVILDSLNNIKGYRYELWCVARFAATKYCMVHVDTPLEFCRSWNSQRQGDTYSDTIFADLAGRFERPDPRQRWDAPLFTVHPCILGTEPTPSSKDTTGQAWSGSSGADVASNQPQQRAATSPVAATAATASSNLATHLQPELDRGTSPVAAAAASTSAPSPEANAQPTTSALQPAARQGATSPADSGATSRQGAGAGPGPGGSGSGGARRTGFSWVKAAGPRVAAGQATVGSLQPGTAANGVTMTGAAGTAMPAARAPGNNDAPGEPSGVEATTAAVASLPATMAHTCAEGVRACSHAAAEPGIDMAPGVDFSRMPPWDDVLDETEGEEAVLQAIVTAMVDAPAPAAAGTAREDVDGALNTGDDESVLGSGAGVGSRSKQTQLTPTFATSSTPLLATNTLHEIDQAAQAVITTISDAQAAAAGGAPGRVVFGEGLPSLQMDQPVALAELRRHKRAFIKLATKLLFARLQDGETARRMFIDYLRSNVAGASAAPSV